MTITLIGMSGAGKSAVAKRLAALMGGRFVDVDETMERNEGEDREEILQRLGEEGFLALEARTVSALALSERMVVSPGASIILSPQALEFLKARSTLVYLHNSFEAIEARIGRGANRGIVGLSKKSLREIYDERLPLYEKYTDIIIDGASGDAHEVAERIYRAITARDLQ